MDKQLKGAQAQPEIIHLFMHANLTNTGVELETGITENMLPLVLYPTDFVLK